MAATYHVLCLLLLLLLPLGYLCLVAAHPPKPIVATYSEHMIGLEMGHDDLMVTDELFQDDEYDDQTYHNEYGPGGWNSIMMADDDNKHNWKAIHIVQIRVAFDQPFVPCIYNIFMGGCYYISTAYPSGGWPNNLKPCAPCRWF